MSADRNGVAGSGHDGPEIHHQHQDVTGGWLRPAVFGVMDGLVSNFALIAGVAGGGASENTVGLTGLAGLVAGAISMATGEYTSVASQSELTRAEI
ncbi:MAG TPA: VIT1/CCC1 transporter family protein, partial [Mycobacteriales bacterium]|nr:VIT1/CCC1 transporter family protein [Mycobacteriales bacterium]